MKISVIGCGRWGSFITWYLNRMGHEMTLYGRENSANMQRFMLDRTNDYLVMPESVKLTYSLDEALFNDIIVISVGSQGLRALCREINNKGVRNKIFVLCMKGIEADSLKRLTEVVSEELHESNKCAVWLGPGHVQEFLKEIPNCMVIDSNDEGVKAHLVETFSSDLIRFYYGTDLIGNEIGAASKNVIGIAAGMLDGYNLVTLKGALMSRGTREIARLIAAMGGNELSAYGLCHLGDYEATVFSEHSHNRRFGEAFVRGESFNKLAEGYYTAAALYGLGKKTGTDLPICNTVYDILYNKAEPSKALGALFQRGLKKEF